MNDAESIMNAARGVGPKTADQLVEAAYGELRRLAASKLAREAPGQTLQATALVHEAWLRLIGDERRRFEDRTHFFAAAAEAMRRILIERARRRRAVRHGGEYERIQMADELLASQVDDEQLLGLNEALEKLELKFPAQAQVVKLRYFAGMTNEEIAELIGVSLSTVKNYWVFAKAWLFREIKRG
ncbi:MAG TPA: ECF-type sigma factor [Candidatus Cybelea sp.]|nr:ECF-type sigma factor [Candidatus Cybelea sp.]